MDLDILATFAVAHLLATASPGPNFVTVTSWASLGSRSKGVFAALGIVFSVIILSGLSAMGIDLLLGQHPELFYVIKFAGAAYLIYLGANTLLRALRVDSSSHSEVHSMQGGNLQVARRAFLVAITNPKYVVYYVNIFAVLVPAESSGVLLLQIIAVTVFVSAAWWIFVALAFSTNMVSAAFRVVRRYLELLSGVALIFFGYRIAVSNDVI